MGNSGEYQGCNRSKPTKSGQRAKTRMRRPSPVNPGMTGFARFAGLLLQGYRQEDGKDNPFRWLFFCRVALVFWIAGTGFEPIRQGCPGKTTGLSKNTPLVTIVVI